MSFNLENSPALGQLHPVKQITRIKTWRRFPAKRVYSTDQCTPAMKCNAKEVAGDVCISSFNYLQAKPTSPSNKMSKWIIYQD